MKKINKFEQEIDNISDIFKLLSEKNRLSIFAILTYEETTVTNIYKCLQLRQNLISHHLQVLKKHKIVNSRRRGREIYYSLNSEKLLDLHHVLTKITQASII